MYNSILSVVEHEARSCSESVCRPASRAAQSERFDSAHDLDAVAYTDNSHLFQHVLFQVQDHISPYVVVAEHGYDLCTFGLGEPLRDVAISPSRNKVAVGDSGGRFKSG